MNIDSPEYRQKLKGAIASINGALTTVTALLADANADIVSATAAYDVADVTAANVILAAKNYAVAQMSSLSLTNVKKALEDAKGAIENKL